MIIERDVAVPMRDGVKIYVDVTRPKGKEKVPALIAWSAYGKHRPFQYGYFFKEGGVKREWYSTYTNFEAPDPLYWVPRGYAIVNVDPRGTWQSEGDAIYWGHEEAQRRPRPDRMGRRAGVVQRQGRADRCLLPGDHSVADRGDAAAASRGDQSLGRLERHVPGVRLSRRHSRDVLHADLAEVDLLLGRTGWRTCRR